MKRFLVALGLAAILLAIVVGVQSRGIRVTIINRGPEPLTDVLVHVTGNQHRLGGLEVGEARTVPIMPTSESDLEVSFVDQAGQPRRLNAGGYFEPGYRGTVEIELQDGAIIRNDHKITLGWF